MKLEEILTRKEDGWYSKWIPSSSNQSSITFRIFKLGEIPEDGWEETKKEEIGSYPSGTVEWTYYENKNTNTKIRKQSGSGYRFGDLADRIK